MRPIDADALLARFDTGDFDAVYQQVLAQVGIPSLAVYGAHMVIEIAEIAQNAIKEAPTLTDEDWLKMPN